MTVRAGPVAITFALAIATLAPAQAEDLAELDCPVANMSAADRGALGETVASLAPNTDARYERFRAMVGQCARGYDWSEAQARFVLVHQLSAAGQEALRRALAQRDVPLAEVEQAVLGDADFMAAAGNGEMNDAAISAFVARHQDLLERVAGAGATAQTGELLGRFIMFRAVAEVTRRQFQDS